MMPKHCEPVICCYYLGSYHLQGALVKQETDEIKQRNGNYTQQLPTEACTEYETQDYHTIFYNAYQSIVIF